MSRPVAVLDACALIPIRLATTLLWLAEAGLFQPLWSDTILDEVQRNLPKVHVDPGTAARRVGMMRNAFGAEALVDGFDELIDDMQCDPKDRHVLAAAVAGGADTIVTFNLKDFPDHAVAPHRVQVLDPDSFLLQLLSEQLETVVSILERETASLRRPPRRSRSSWKLLLLPPQFSRTLPQMQQMSHLERSLQYPHSSKLMQTVPPSHSENLAI